MSLIMTQTLQHIPILAPKKEKLKKLSFDCCYQKLISEGENDH